MIPITMPSSSLSKCDDYNNEDNNNNIINNNTNNTNNQQQQQQHQIMTKKKKHNKKKTNKDKEKDQQLNGNHIKQKKPKVNKTAKNQSNLITNYFPIISRRLLDAKLKEEEYNKKIIYFIENKTDPKEYLSVTEFETKGKAIIATAPIYKGSFICEYSGDLIDLQTAKVREDKYELNKAGCYMYYFNWNSTIWCVDATEPTGRYGRLINHSRKAPNCKTRIFEHNHQPHLIFVALKDINPNEEILYDYGERDPLAIKSNPWLSAS